MSKSKTVKPGSLKRMVGPLRARNITELNTAVLANKCLAWGSGALAAANLAGSMYNSVSKHKCDLADCLLAKLNLLKPGLKIRLNPYWSNVELTSGGQAP